VAPSHGLKHPEFETDYSPPSVPRLRMYGTSPPLSYTSSWCSALTQAQLNHFMAALKLVSKFLNPLPDLKSLEGGKIM
jgi:hypothetical protein